MGDSYHPLYSSVWNDEKLEGAPFEEKGFFVYLFSNPLVRPSGIYRVSNAQLAGFTGLPAKRVVVYGVDLEQRGVIVRDGTWLFVVSYLKRQPKGQYLMRGVYKDIDNCSSLKVLDALVLKYPLLDRRVADRRATVGQRVAYNYNATTTQLEAATAASSSNGYGPRDADVAPDAVLMPSAPPSHAADWLAAPWPSVEALAHLYNTLTPDHCPAVETLSEQRRKRARRWLRAFPERAWWVEVFAEYRKSRFLSGLTQPSPGHESFRPDFDWLLANGRNGTENAVKVHDGQYREVRHGPP